MDEAEKISCLKEIREGLRDSLAKLKALKTLNPGVLDEKIDQDIFECEKWLRKVEEDLSRFVGMA